MRDVRPVKNDRTQSSAATARSAVERQKAKSATETARKLVARAHQAAETSQELMQSYEERRQHQ